MRTTHEFRDFELSCEKHIMALASTKTGTYLSSSSGPSGPRTRMFRPLSGPSGPRVTVLFFFFFFGDNTAAGACQRPDGLFLEIFDKKWIFFLVVIWDINFLKFL